MQPLPSSPSKSAASTLPPVGPAAPENSGPDPRDGRFAAAMAQAVQPSAPPPPPAKAAPKEALDAPAAPGAASASSGTAEAHAPAGGTAKPDEKADPEPAKAGAPATAAPSPSPVLPPGSPLVAASVAPTVPIQASTASATATEDPGTTHAVPTMDAKALAPAVLPAVPASPAESTPLAAPTSNAPSALPVPPASALTNPDPAKADAAPKPQLPASGEAPVAARPAAPPEAFQAPMSSAAAAPTPQASNAEDAASAPTSLPALKSGLTAARPQSAVDPGLDKLPPLPTLAETSGAKVNTPATPAPEAASRPTSKEPTPALQREAAPEAVEEPRAQPRVDAAKETSPGHELLADAETPKLAPKGEAKVPLPVAAQTTSPTSFATLAKTEAAALSAAPNPSMAQLEGGVKWMLRAGAPEAQLQLHPESLGQVSIHLKVEDGQVHARLWVSEPASVQAIQDGRAHLEQSLRQQGLQLGSFDLQQGRQPQRGAAFSPSPSRAERESQPEAPRAESLPAPLVRPGTSRRIELIA